MATLDDVLAIILAGGRGTRLHNLTKERAKPALPFAGYRLIDIMLSDLINSNIPHIHLLTEYKSDSLNDHITKWHQRVGFGEFIRTVPAQQRELTEFSRGSGDSLYNHLFNLENLPFEASEYVVLSGDHVTDLNVGKLVDYHRKLKADITLTVRKVTLEQARKKLGVVVIDKNQRVIGFEEKPESPTPLPDDPEHCFANEANTVFESDIMDDAVEEFLPGPDEKEYDLSKHILTPLIQQARQRNLKIRAYLHEGYWADVGTIDALFNSNMDLLSSNPLFNIYDDDWWYKTFTDKYQGSGGKLGETGKGSYASIFNPGSRISGVVEWSVLSYGVEVLPGAFVSHACLFDGCKVRHNARVIRAILDKDVSVGDRVVIDPGNIDAYFEDGIVKGRSADKYRIKPLSENGEYLLFQRANDGRSIEGIVDKRGKSILDKEGLYIKQSYMKGKKKATVRDYIEFVRSPGDVLSFSKYSYIPDGFVI